MSDFDEENNAGGVDPILAVIGAGILGVIGWLFGKRGAEDEKNKALQAKDEEIKALIEKYDAEVAKFNDLMKEYDEQKLENSELIEMCDKLIAELESNQRLPSNYKGKLIAQLKKKHSILLRSSAA